MMFDKINYRRLVVRIVFFVMFVRCSHAQNYQFRHYSVEDGLSHSTVLCVGQDSSGFIWIGTKAGLNRFDGYHFRSFELINKKGDRRLFEEVIHSLYTDKKGRLWAGTKQGLFLYDNVKEIFTRVLDSLTNIYLVFVDRRGLVWLITQDNLCKYEPAIHSLKKFPNDQYFHASSICEASDGTLWIGAADGMLRRYNPASDTFTSYDLFEHSVKPSSNTIEQVYPAPNNALFVATSTGGVKLFSLRDLKYQDIVINNNRNNSLLVHDIVRKSDSEFWFATETGILVYKIWGNEFVSLTKKLQDPFSLSANEVYSLFRDKDGGIWIGTYFGGLNYYSSQNDKFEKYFPGREHIPLSGNVVRAICSDRLGNLWVGTEDAGLNKINQQTGKITVYKPQSGSNAISYWNIHGLMIDNTDVWIGTFEHGLDVLDMTTGFVKKHEPGNGRNGLSSNFIFGFLKYSNGSIYVAASNGVYRYDKITGLYEHLNQLAAGHFVYALMEDHNHIIWAATDGGGLCWFDPKNNRHGQFLSNSSDSNSLTNNRVNALYEDSYDNIWLATEGGGVCKLDSTRTRMSHYSTQNGLPSNYIYKVIEDNEKKMWFTTSRGLVEFNPVNSNINVYTKANGLLNDQFNYQSGFKAENGRLYFGSIQGMISFNPLDLRSRHMSQDVFITGAQANNVELASGDDSLAIPYTRTITLPYDRSSVSFDFAAINYESPMAAEYNYVLEGLQKEWTPIKENRKVYYTNLPPGKYLFRVKAYVGGERLTGGAAVKLIILPPLWASKWAYLFYLIISASIFLLVIKVYRERILIKREKEIYKAKIEFFTRVAHEIKTPLSLIIGPLENLTEKADELTSIKDDVSMMDRNAKNLDKLVKQVLDFSTTEAKNFSLRFITVNIVSLIRETYHLFEPLAKKNNLHYSLVASEEVITMAADPEALDKIFNNLFSNALKYAASIVEVKIDQDIKNKEVFISIQNDGYLIPKSLEQEIFKPFYRLQETAAESGSGIGLSIASSFVKLHNGQLNLSFNVTGMNTFVVRLPIN